MTTGQMKNGIRLRGQVWWIRYFRDGRRHEESSHSTEHDDARRLLKVRQGDVARGLPVTPKIGRLRFEEAAADLVNDYKTNGKRSLPHVERRIALHLQPFFGGRRMTAITTADVRTFIAQRQAAGASNGEINRELACLKRAFRLAEQAAKLLHHPYIPMLREHNIRTGFFEREEFEAVRDALPAPLRGVVTFAYLTGWRVPSEVLTLQWRNVDRTAGVVRLDPGTTKNAEGRTFPYGDLLPELRDVINAQWTETKRVEQTREIVCPWVFHRDGRPIRHLYGAWRAACAAAGCPGKIPHDFRRTAVRNLVRAGVPERVAMQLTGHKTRSVFDRYDIVSEADLSDAVAKLAGAPAAATRRGGQVRRMRR